VPVYIRDMPFSDRPHDLSVLGVAVRAFAYEPIVWVSLTPHEVTTLPTGAPRFHAVVDTGNTLALNIRASHLTAWDSSRRASPCASITNACWSRSGAMTRLRRRQAVGSPRSGGGCGQEGLLPPSRNGPTPCVRRKGRDP
jgi:hypothetical protein